MKTFYQYRPKAAVGYVLIEALVAMMVVSAGILGIAKLQSTVVRATAEAKASSLATTLARAKIEELRNTVVSSQHFQSGCAAGTIIFPGEDEPITEASDTLYKRKWDITQNCSPTRHLITVTVSWTGADDVTNERQLTSLVAWNDPSRTTTQLAAGTSGGGVGGSPATARFINDEDYEAPEGSTKNSNSDGVTIYVTPNEEYVLVDSTGTAIISSTVPYVRLSGIIALERGTTTAATTLLSNVFVYRTDVTYCVFPLKYTAPDDSITYSPMSSTEANVAKSAAYVCYVPQGWTGNIGLIQRSYECSDKFNLFDGSDTPYGNSCKFRKDLACPGRIDGSATLSGIRSIKVLIRDGDSIIGASGVMPSHEAMLQDSRYPNAAQTERLDFFIFKPSNPGQLNSNFCGAQVPNTYDADPANNPISPVFRRQGEWTGTGPEGTEGVPSIVYTDHALKQVQ